MKVIFISDIHGLYNNLSAIEKKIETEKINKLAVQRRAKCAESYDDYDFCRGWLYS